VTLLILWEVKKPTNQGNDGYTIFCHITVTNDGFIAVNNFTGYLCDEHKTNRELNNVQFTK